MVFAVSLDRRKHEGQSGVSQPPVDSQTTCVADRQLLEGCLASGLMWHIPSVKVTNSEEGDRSLVYAVIDVAFAILCRSEYWFPSGVWGLVSVFGFRPNEPLGGGGQAPASPLFLGPYGSFHNPPPPPSSESTGAATVSCCPPALPSSCRRCHIVVCADPVWSCFGPSAQHGSRLRGS